jgi:pimeloyl-ACP methyl ester carboxylesterase
MRRTTGRPSAVAMTMGVIAALGMAFVSAREAQGRTEANPGVEAQEPAPAPSQDSPSATQWKSLGKSFSFEGQEVFYVDQGEGPVTLAIHGYPTSSWDFRRLLGPLTRESRLVAPDLLGFGFSAKPKDASYTISRQADLVAELVAHLGVNQVRLIGSDIGNAVVQELLSRDRARSLRFGIHSVVLINGSLFADQFSPTSTQRALLSPLGGIVNQQASEAALVAGLTQISGPEKRIPAGDLSEVWRLLNYPSDARLMHKTLPTVEERRRNDSRWTEALCASAMPLMFVVGEADPTAGREMASATTARCQGQRLFSTLKLPQAGHFPHLEYAEETANAIRAWSEGGY